MMLQLFILSKSCDHKVCPSTLGSTQPPYDFSLSFLTLYRLYDFRRTFQSLKVHDLPQFFVEPLVLGGYLAFIGYFILMDISPSWAFHLHWTFFPYWTFRLNGHFALLDISLCWVFCLHWTFRLVWEFRLDGHFALAICMTI